jgi:F-type H+-transporting ATPase subunit a
VLKKLFTVRNLIILLAIVATFAVSAALGLKVPAPVVSLAAEPVFHIGFFSVTNSLLLTWIVMIVLIVLAVLATRRIPKDMSKASNSDLVPSGIQNVFEMIIEAIYNLTRSVAGSWTPKLFPVVGTIFLFVLFANYSGLLPGVGTIGWLEHPHGEGAGFVANGAVLTATPAPDPESGYIVVPWLRAPSADLNFTLALAVVTVFLTQYFGVKAQRGHYFKKFFDTSGFKQGVFMGAIGIFVGILELVGELARLLSFSFRLFGNVFAGEVLLLVMAFLIPYFASLPFYGLELFVGFIQAAVFMMLAVVFMSMATEGHGGGGHDEAHGGASHGDVPEPVANPTAPGA